MATGETDSPYAPGYLVTVRAWLPAASRIPEERIQMAQVLVLIELQSDAEDPTGEKTLKSMLNAERSGGLLTLSWCVGEAVNEATATSVMSVVPLKTYPNGA